MSSNFCPPPHSFCQCCHPEENIGKLNYLLNLGQARQLTNLSKNNSKTSQENMSSNVNSPVGKCSKIT